jgi:chromosome segregation ATPase
MNDQIVAALANCTTQRQELERQNDALRSREEQLNGTIEARNRKMATLEAEINQRPTRQAFEELQKERDRLSRENQKLSQQVSEARAETFQERKALFAAQETLKLNQERQNTLLGLIAIGLQRRLETSDLPPWINVANPDHETI